MQINPNFCKSTISKDIILVPTILIDQGALQLAYRWFAVGSYIKRFGFIWENEFSWCFLLNPRGLTAKAIERKNAGKKT